MITPYLEKLIWEGSARYIVYPVGGSGVGTIPFPKGSRMMVVTDFTWFPFCDIPINERSGRNVGKSSIHTLSLFNGKDKSIFNFRDNPIVSNANDELYTTFNPPISLNCYLGSEQDIRINIFKFDFSGIAPVLDVIPIAPSQEQTTPNGYGTGNAVRVFSTPSVNIIEMGKDRDPNAVLNTPRQRNQFFDDVTPANMLAAPSQNDCYTFPLINFGVVIINDQPNSNFP